MYLEGLHCSVIRMKIIIIPAPTQKAGEDHAILGALMPLSPHHHHCCHVHYFSSLSLAFLCPISTPMNSCSPSPPCKQFLIAVVGLHHPSLSLPLHVSSAGELQCGRGVLPYLVVIPLPWAPRYLLCGLTSHLHGEEGMGGLGQPLLLKSCSNLTESKKGVVS